jgi:hypothetical protein
LEMIVRMRAHSSVQKGPRPSAILDFSAKTDRADRLVLAVSGCSLLGPVDEGVR